MFNRYDKGMAFGAHVDGSIRVIPQTGQRSRTDVSTTIFLTPPEDYDSGELLIHDTYAAQALPEASWAYIQGGSADGLTQRANEAARQAQRIRPRVLRDLRAGSTACQLLGLDLSHPFALAPVASQGLVHPEGELAQGAGATGGS